MANTKSLKITGNTKNKRESLQAKGKPKDLFEYKGKWYQKVDDDGIPSQLWLRLGKPA